MISIRCLMFLIPLITASLSPVYAFHPSPLSSPHTRNAFSLHKRNKSRRCITSALHIHDERSHHLNELNLATHDKCDESSRRTFIYDSLRGMASSLLVIPITTATTAAAAAESKDEELIDVYFGCGCFWHVQHEFVQAERRILNRSDEELTARAGYAGGKSGALDGKVCYHNGKGISDYGKLGHAEVVHLQIPPSSYKEFAMEYTKLFDKNGFRPDQAGDRGSEYRNLVGFPGGANSDLYLQQLISASKENGDKLAFGIGQGDDADRRALVYVMDSSVREYPFFVAEAYHQFHDGFAKGENYPNAYNDIAKSLDKVGKLSDSKCPSSRL